MKRVRRALHIALLAATHLVAPHASGNLTADALAFNAGTAAYTLFGGPAYGFIVSIPADWSRKVTGAAAQGAELDAAGPAQSGMTLLVGQQPVGRGQSLATLLPSGSHILQRADV